MGCQFLLQGSPCPRNRTWVSCMAGRWFTNWALRIQFSSYLGGEFHLGSQAFRLLQCQTPVWTQSAVWPCFCPRIGHKTPGSFLVLPRYLGSSVLFTKTSSSIRLRFLILNSATVNSELYNSIFHNINSTPHLSFYKYIDTQPWK